MAATDPAPLVVAVDTGGTFTDLVARTPDGGRAHLKVPSTPDDPGRAVAEAVRTLAARLGRPPAEVRHGTTVATNAVLERRGARVALITNAGFEDLLRLGRQARPALYALHPEVPPPLVPPDRCFGVPGRQDAGGALIEAYPDADAWVAAHTEALADAEAFCVAFLHAYADATHEQGFVEALTAAFPGRPTVGAATLAPVFREYERTSTAAVDAFVAPVTAGYLDRLADALAPARLLVMGSGGGLLSAERAAAEPVHTVLSGPAGGVRGAWAVGRRNQRTALLTVDMGGTSTDVSFVSGVLQPEDEGEVGGHPLRIPLLPIDTVGAGGGSIAFVDAGGALRVGPRSAGAVPGPVCYGHPDAHEPTVTDAHVVLGRLPDLLGGSMPLDRAAARAAVGRLAAALGAPLEATAEAILAVAESNMARACKRVSMERGIDPRTLTLVAFGGAGGLHACALADALGCPDVLFPAEPGVLSAEGILGAPREVARTRSVFLEESGWTEDTLERPWRETRADAEDTLAPELPAGTAVSTATWADCRYVGQTYTLPVPIDAPPTPARLRPAFEAIHTARYGYAFGPADAPGGRAVECVAMRSYAREAATEDAAPAAADAPPPTVGPVAIPAYSATLWLPEGWRAVQQPSGDLLCTRVSGAERADPTAATGLALEVHRQRLAAIAEEMGATLMRAAFSANIKERRDFSCAVFDRAGRLLVHAAHIPVHLGSTPLSVRAAIEAVDMRDGTEVLLNDPFAGGTHLPDVTLVTPVHIGEEPAPRYYVANRAHHADVGGIAPGSLPSPRDADGNVRTLTIDDEGIRIPPTALDDALRGRFAAASRTPAERSGDLRAQEAANRVGRTQLEALAAELGGAADDLDAALLDYAERRMRAVIAELPDGAWTCTEWLDDDGAGDAPIPIPLTLRIDGDTAELDFTAAPDTVAGPMNAVRAIVVSAAFYVLRCVAGAGLPANEGLMRPVTIRTRPGSVVDARAPAAVSAGNVETSQRLVDVIFAALRAAAPDRIPSDSGGSMNNVLLGGTTGSAWVQYETLACGAGASAAGPGADAIHTHMTNTLNTPVEAAEHAFPFRIERYAVRPPGDAVPGGHRGGAGIERAWRLLAPTEINLLSERRRLAPAGTPPGVPGENLLIRADGTIVELPGKVTIRAAPGDLLVVRTPGGGGWAPESD